MSELLTAEQWAQRMRADYAAVDKSYRRFPLGEDVGRFLRAKRVEGAKPNTLVTYEHALRPLVLDHRDLSLADLGVGREPTCSTTSWPSGGATQRREPCRLALQH
jgi:hypothetical protein